MVIATSQAIRDDAARTFAEFFYKSLGSGSTVSAAFEEAKASVGLQVSGSYRELYLEDHGLEDHGENGQPWQLFIRPGAESAAEWNLPDAAGDPLFSLPALPYSDLPT